MPYSSLFCNHYAWHFFYKHLVSGYNVLGPKDTGHQRDYPCCLSTSRFSRGHRQGTEQGIMVLCELWGALKKHCRMAAPLQPASHEQIGRTSPEDHHLDSTATSAV